MDTLGLRLKAARERQGYSVQQLSQLTGIAADNLTAFEEDRYAPPLSMLFALQKPLKCTVEWLLSGEEPEISPIESTSACNGIPLSQVEHDLIAMFRLLGEHDRENAFDLVSLLYRKATGKCASDYLRHIDTD